MMVTITLRSKHLGKVFFSKLGFIVEVKTFCRVFLLGLEGQILFSWREALRVAPTVYWNTVVHLI